MFGFNFFNFFLGWGGSLILTIILNTSQTKANIHLLTIVDLYNDEHNGIINEHSTTVPIGDKFSPWISDDINKYPMRSKIFKMKSKPSYHINVQENPSCLYPRQNTGVYPGLCPSKRMGVHPLVFVLAKVWEYPPYLCPH